MARLGKLTVVTALVLFVAAGGQRLVLTDASAAPKVLVTVKPIHSLVASVMQGIGTPDLLLTGNATPHSFSMRPSDARKLQSADVIFWIGPEMESVLTKPVGVLNKRARVVALIRQRTILRRRLRKGGVWEDHKDHDHDSDHDDHDHDHGKSKGHKHSQGHKHGHGKHSLDGHIWLDPRNAQAIVRIAAATLAKADPQNAAKYRANARRTVARLVALEARLRRQLRPVSRRPYIVFHDAWQYFEKRFGLNPAGSITLEGERTPGARRLYEIRSAILKRKARCVFTEPQFPTRLAATVVEGTPARVAALDPLGAQLTAGPEAYFQLLQNLATDLTRCLK